MTRTVSLYETCQNLFDQYPLAVSNHDSMVLAMINDGEPAFYGLGRFTSGFDVWTYGGLAFAHITPDTGPSLAGDATDILTRGLPLPGEGTFFGWQSGGVITTVIAAHTEQDEGHPYPTYTTMPLRGTPESSWAPFTGERLLGPWFWDHYRNGSVVDLAPLTAATPDAIFWTRPEGLTYPCCAVARDVTSPDGWVLPQGCYVWYQTLRDGQPIPSLDEILAGDVTDLSPLFRTGA